MITLDSPTDDSRTDESRSDATQLLLSNNPGNGRFWNRKVLNHEGGLYRWLYRTFLFVILIVISISILRHPLATNDGPVHVSFSHLILTLHQPNHPLQQQAYTVQLRPNPNLAVYLLMAFLMRIASPAFAESVIQILCIVGPVLAGYFAIHTINPKNTWLSIFILPLALNEMLFLGLYNHSLSTAAFFTVIGTYFWMKKDPSSGRAAALSCALIFTFFCHASGFIMSFAGLGVMSATSAWLIYRRERNYRWPRATALKEGISAQRFTLAAMIAPLPLAALFLVTGDKGPTIYGYNFFVRVLNFLRMDLLAVNFPIHDRFAASAISVLLLGSFGVVCVRIRRNAQRWPIERRDQAIGVAAAFVIAVIIMLAFPDQMGGGWTHFRRFETFPLFWILILLAFESFTATFAWGFVALAASSATLLVASMIARQSMIRTQMAPLATVDKLVGDHCTVLPVVLQSYLVDRFGYPEWATYQPYFQSASRLELTGDRVVLFNYLARLTPYPVHFRPGMEPQGQIFRWKPQQADNTVDKVDVSDYENNSGLKVDYILVWGSLADKSLDMRQQVQNALSNYDLIYKSPNNRAALYERLDGRNPGCAANASAPETAGAH